jgi:hypothetical protein
MRKECYLFEVNASRELFDFFSEGPKGRIKKTIEYENIGNNYYNLGFGDRDEIRNVVNDKARSNNGDRDKVLATVASSVSIFMEYHPGATILAVGEIPSKTRLYQIGINKHWAEISAQFFVEGFRNGFWEPFEPG